ncbi:hypothetical protein IWX49DRAFT_599668 [Phyllosticta citricarpa]|uniref:25S rRNA (uridine-N(3))-methyltransferase BMT5-like domain-containing protein n=2 Tax=Phyllosticta TaxID=121621 RepID=A0ABR1LUW6_9PEZI
MARTKKAAFNQRRHAGSAKEKLPAKTALHPQPPAKKQKAEARDTAHAKPSTISSTANPSKPVPQKPTQQPKQTAPPPPPPTIPFDPNERILLIGEGDFSFARSLVSHHGCADLLATCYDSAEALGAKYPQARDNVAYIEGEGMRVAYGVDATNLAKSKEVKRGGVTEGLAGVEGGARSDDVARARGKWDRIVFMFPHTGGKSTDVNRQVRFNQELLVSFFRSAVPLLSPSPPSPTPSTIIVTLFEGEPYTLWNVRDLARHVGLKVQRSFRFQFDAYPGYKHARTLGNIEGGGGWKGEERAARTFVFEAGTGGGEGGASQKGGKEKGEKRKRKKGGDSDSDSD